jgi:hypothetical protein
MNAKSIFGDAAAFVIAKRMGHSVAVSEKLYAGLVEVPPDAKTLEAAMQIEPQLTEIITRLKARSN